MIRQPLGLFFSVFSSRRVGAPEIILQAFSPTLRGTEELHDELIDQAKISNLFVTLLRTDISSKIGKPSIEKGSYHGQLALIILEEIRQEIIPLQILAKALSGIHLEDSDGVIGEKLSSQALRTYKWLTRRSGERRILNTIKKFKEEADKIQVKYEKNNENIEPKPEGVNENFPDVSKGDQSSIRETSRRNRSSSMSQLNKSVDPKKVKKIEAKMSTSSLDMGSSKVSFHNKTEIEVIEESTTLESNDESENELKTSSRPEAGSIVEPVTEESTRRNELKTSLLPEADSIVEPVTEESTRSSEDILAPSPPKKRMLRSRKK